MENYWAKFTNEVKQIPKDPVRVGILAGSTAGASLIALAVDNALSKSYEVGVGPLKWEIFHKMAGGPKKEFTRNLIAGTCGLLTSGLWIAPLGMYKRELIVPAAIGSGISFGMFLIKGAIQAAIAYSKTIKTPEQIETELKEVKKEEKKVKKTESSIPWVAAVNPLAALAMAKKAADEKAALAAKKKKLKKQKTSGQHHMLADFYPTKQKNMGIYQPEVPMNPLADYPNQAFNVAENEVYAQAEDAEGFHQDYTTDVESPKQMTWYSSEQSWDEKPMTKEAKEVISEMWW